MIVINIEKIKGKLKDIKKNIFSVYNCKDIGYYHPTKDVVLSPTYEQWYHEIIIFGKKIKIITRTLNYL